MIGILRYLVELRDLVCHSNEIRHLPPQSDATKSLFRVRIKVSLRLQRQVGKNSEFAIVIVIITMTGATGLIKI